MARAKTDPQMRMVAEASVSLLGALLISPQSFDVIELNVDDLTQQWQRDVYQTIADLVAQRKAVDFVTVAGALETRRVLRPQGRPWAETLQQLYIDTPSAANIEAYARIIHEDAVLRRAREAAASFVAGGKDLDAVSGLVQQLMAIEDVRRGRARRISEDIPDFIDYLDRLQHGELTGLTTGIPGLDSYMGGWIGGDLTVVAARTAVGKTALMLNFSRAIFDKSHAIFSSEQPARQLLQRYCAMISEINAQSIRLGNLTDEEWGRLMNDALQQIQVAPVYVDDSPNIRIDQIVRQTRKWRYQEKIEAVFVDYAQRVRPSAREDSRAEQIAEVMRSLKSLALELDIPVIALAQLNREVEKRADHRPSMQDLKGSGALEEESDGIVAIYRPAMYDDTIMDKSKTELIILKNRHGPLGYTNVEFQYQFMRYVPYPEKEDPQPQLPSYFT